MHALKLVFISLLFSASIVWANEHCYLVITNARPEKNLIETVKIDWRGENLFLNFNSLEKGAHKIEEYTIKNRANRHQVFVSAPKTGGGSLSFFIKESISDIRT